MIQSLLACLLACCGCCQDEDHKKAAAAQNHLVREVVLNNNRAVPSDIDLPYGDFSSVKSDSGNFECSLLSDDLGADRKRMRSSDSADL